MAWTMATHNKIRKRLSGYNAAATRQCVSEVTVFKRSRNVLKAMSTASVQNVNWRPTNGCGMKYISGAETMKWNQGW